jgi:hypothetical protein
MYVPPELTLKNSAFCPQIVCVFRIVLAVNSDYFSKQH